MPNLKKPEKLVIWICFASTLILASCGARKNLTANASGAAKAMANLKNKRLYKFITDWVGVSYKNGGMDKRGVDCSGFTYLLANEIYGYKLPRTSTDQANAIREKKIGRLKEGDLIFFSFNGYQIDHVGVYLGDDFFVHASTSKGVIVEDFTKPRYQKYIVKTGALK